jgi:hypothetical protein
VVDWDEVQAWFWLLPQALARFKPVQGSFPPRAGESVSNRGQRCILQHDFPS